MNGFLIPEKTKCNRQIGQQKLTAEKLRMWFYNRKTGKHYPKVVITKEYLQK